MAAFKEHCTFGFWRGIELPDPEGLLERIGKTAMGNLGKLKKIEDLPKQIHLEHLIREAMKLNESNSSAPKLKRPKTIISINLPSELNKAFSQKKNKDAQHFFESLAPSHKKEFCKWINEAKKAETRIRRIEQTLIMLKEKKKKM
ncbi:MAG TPA: hypothetical protein DCD96_02865 [Flavobacteriales bacterium]|nr:hypothetical protein [Flavobacteriales bacterium]